MAIAPDRPAAPLPALPGWDRTPADPAEATRQVKSAIRTRIAASGRSIEEVFAVAEQLVRVRAAFLTGSSPSDFPPEHYEREWTDRFGVQDLNATGRRGLSLI